MNSHHSPIDFNKAMEITDNDINLFESMMDVFLDVKSEYILNIRNAVMAQNSLELQTSAHQAKSGLGSIGATIASQLALKLEQMGENSVFDNIDEIVEVFEKELILIENYAREKEWIKKSIGSR